MIGFRHPYTSGILFNVDLTPLFSANLEAQRSIKNAEAAKVDAERAQAVAIARLEAAQQQVDDRAQALQHEQQARRADAEAHKVVLAEQRDE